MLESLILIVLGFFFLIVLPILATIKYWNFKPFVKYALVLMWISYGVLSYEVFFPRDSYYINHLKNASGLNFDSNLIIKEKYTSLINSKARYYSCAVFEINEAQKKLFSNLDIKNSKFIKPLDNMNKCSEILNPILSNSSIISFEKIDEKNYRAWGFTKDSNKVFLFYRFLGMSDN